jgi:hypothetical protein
MSEVTSLRIYDKMLEFIESVFSVFQMVNKKAETQQDKRLKIIALVIFNYVRKTASDFKVNLKALETKEIESINLIPIFEYIAYNNIELYDFDKIDVNDVDTSKKSDLERFVLTHVYYITQPRA